jgi:hypothetical protein
LPFPSDWLRNVRDNGNGQGRALADERGASRVF